MATTVTFPENKTVQYTVFHQFWVQDFLGRPEIMARCCTEAILIINPPLLCVNT